MSLVKVRAKAQITLPATVRRALGIEEGDYLEARIEGNKVVLIPQTLVTRFPVVTLSEQGEQMLEQALEDVNTGRVKQHESTESLIDELHHEATED